MNEVTSMSILIVYESKGGYTKECAHTLEKYLAGSGRAVEVQAAGKENLAGYDRVVIGSAVYAGRVPARIRRFVKKNMEDLLHRPLSLFVCGTAEEFKDTYYEKNYPEQILNHADRREWFGGHIILEDHHGLKKMILSSILKGEKELHRERLENIEPFAGFLLGS